MDRFARGGEDNAGGATRELREGEGRAGEGGRAFGLESASLPERARFLTEFSREITIRYRGQVLSCDGIRSPKNAAAFVLKIIGDDSKEHFVALHLDGRHRAIGHAVLSRLFAVAVLDSPNGFSS